MRRVVRNLMVLCLALSLASCSKHHYTFHLYFYPYGTGLKNNDWEQVSNVKVNYRGKNLFGREPAQRLVMVINDREQNKFVEYDTGWSTYPILQSEGEWISQDVFLLSYEMKIEGDVLKSETIRFTIPPRS